MATETAIKERPILFSGPMVRAILEGRKTQTRRIVKPPKRWNANIEKAWPDLLWGVTPGLHVPCNYIGEPTVERLGNPWQFPEASRLWVREAWSPMPNHRPIANPERYDSKPAWYRADNDRPMWAGSKWKPSIHMPRWASRITLEITGVRVEQLGDITESDAIAEGAIDQDSLNEGYSAVGFFNSLWSRINGDFDRRTWVWVVEFRKLEPNQ